MQILKAVENRMFPHILSAFQWILIVMCLAFSLNFSVAVTGAVANDGLKVIMFFHVWMLFLPAVICLLFYRIRKEGKIEKYVIAVSMITALFSIANVSLHLVNGFALLMKTIEVIAWGLYNCMFSISMYKISIVFLLPTIRRFAGIDKETLPDRKKIWA
jgi:O-antigen ligase